MSGGGEDGIDRVTLGAGRMVLAHAAAVHDVADHGFDRGVEWWGEFVGRRPWVFA